ncbi:MAG: DUF2760 domain-containing protein [Gemmataceae bacterium]|nr:DUF2760 domain-containing protein [Gemmataceae bacterium]MDW8243852.1 DUF2760 domain-containing protein [Thermogemmata sp.]
MDASTELDWIIALATGLVVGVVGTLIVLWLRVGQWKQFGEALALLRRMQQDPALAERIRQALQPAATERAPFPPAALRLLAVLQEQARLVDFLQEDLSGASDAQIGQAVREIHRQARRALQEHLVLEPVLAATEGETVTIPAGYDPSAIRVIGHVTGTPPYRGQVEHPGWRAREVRLPEVVASADPHIIQPAVVQIPEPPQ